MSWGYGNEGRLGHGDPTGRATPTVVELLKGKDGMALMVMISAGDCHSAALQDNLSLALSLSLTLTVIATITLCRVTGRRYCVYMGLGKLL